MSRRVLIKKTAEGWKMRFMVHNPWKMPEGEWLPSADWTVDTPAHLVTASLMKDYPGCDVLTMCLIGEDL